MAYYNSKKVGLLCGAGTGFATFFYAMIRSLPVKAALLATIHQPKFAELNLSNQVRSAVMDIESKNFWKAVYTVVRAVFPESELFVFAMNTPCMC